jgi:hypothetical protein
MPDDVASGFYALDKQRMREWLGHIRHRNQDHRFLG